MLQLVADRDIPSVGPRAPLPLGQPMDQGTFGVRGARATDSKGSPLRSRVPQTGQRGEREYTSSRTTVRAVRRPARGQITPAPNR